MGLKRTVDAATEPVTLAEAKAHCRVTSTADDTLITTLIKTARQLCEQYTGLAFISQTWEFNLDRFPSTQGSESDWHDGVREGLISQVDCQKRYIDIPIAPLISISSLATFNDAGDSATMDAAGYIVDTRRIPGRITLATGAIWPVNLRPANAILITFTAGYADANSVPALLKHAVLVAIGHLYDNRTAPPVLSEGAMQILNPFRVMRL
jgi:hypothetical protein